ncbi:MAG TPA: aminotransferase class III-fold pyridoxal phosphate-dependent enzyme, partial [Lacipirellulaceae bacterium]|nr:aminotransferase class III-fold pyridoxal phosphate-dependent enzyme [Lacipirellulaceae bacterium]
ELRVRGLMIGLELTIEGAPIVGKCLDRGLLINCTQNAVIRLLPAMTLSDSQVNEGCAIISDVLRNHA